jgi:dihydropteroate synthase
VWGVVNVTPDSFHDGGRHATVEAGVRHGLALVAEGADVLDVGGESTRPGARPVPEREERARVVPVIEGLLAAGVRVPVSVDTRKAAVADAALAAGASIVNDVSAGTHDEALLEVVARRKAGLVLMHMRGTPETMQVDPRYEDPVREVLAWLEERAERAEAAGIARPWIDPGIGFGKRLEDNLALLSGLGRFVATGRPVLVGASRKSFLGRITGREVEDRLAGSLAVVAHATLAGVAAIRVHDVAATRDVVAVIVAIDRAGGRLPAQGPTA